jgi:uncharacterized membrane protein
MTRASGRASAIAGDSQLRRAGVTHALATGVATRRRSGARRTPADNEAELEAAPSHALDENIEAIKTWQRASTHHRSRVEHLSDAITRVIAGGPALLFHVVWFGFWILANLELIPGVPAFDPFPFQLLTMTVSLEAIFLSLFVLASQNRMTHEADKRANLDLQINLLAEREMTAVLRLLQDIARHLDVKVSLTGDQISDLIKKTDIQALADRMEELAEDAPQSDEPAAPARRRR